MTEENIVLSLVRVPAGFQFSFSTPLDVPVTCGQTENLNVEICIVADASGSFENDLINLRRAASDIFDGVNNLFAESRFGVTSFVDYPGFGTEEDYPYRVYTQMTENLTAFELAIDDIALGDGGDVPEAQYDGIVSASQGDELDGQSDCGWSHDNDSFERVLIAWTDSPFHNPGEGKPHKNDRDSTLNVLLRERIRLIGLKTATAGTELDFLADATGGTVRDMELDGRDVTTEILGALEDDFSCRVFVEAIGCEPLTLLPSTQVVVQPGSTTLVQATLSTLGVASGTNIQCQLEIRFNRVLVETIDVNVMVE